MSDEPNTLTVPGLPPLTWDRGHGWQCEARWTAWAELLPATEERAAGVVTVTFDCPDIDARTPPSAGQVAAFVAAEAHGGRLRDAVLQAVFDERDDWPGEDVLEELLGEPLTAPAQLVPLIGLCVVGVGEVGDDGVAELDLDFSPAWDEEHGFMAVARGGEITYVGPR